VALFCGLCGLGAAVGLCVLGNWLALPLIVAGAYKVTTGGYQIVTGCGEDD
jgi:hypothetical protein